MADLRGSRSSEVWSRSVGMMPAVVEFARPSQGRSPSSKRGDEATPSLM